MRPEIVKDEHLKWLNALRASGKCNMFGAAAPLAEAFELSKNNARTILVYWMENFKEESWKYQGSFKAKRAFRRSRTTKRISSA